jgi:hypothetical protein
MIIAFAIASAFFLFLILVFATRRFIRSTTLCSGCGKRINKYEAWCMDENFYRNNTTKHEIWYCKACI